MSGTDFERFILEAYQLSGYECEFTKGSGDFGIDILAQKNGELKAIQVKRYKGKVGVAAVQQASSGRIYYKADNAVVVTNSVFTEAARELARSNQVELVDKDSLFDICKLLGITCDVPNFSMSEYEKKRDRINRRLGNVF